MSTSGNFMPFKAGWHRTLSVFDGRERYDPEAAYTPAGTMYQISPTLTSLAHGKPVWTTTSAPGRRRGQTAARDAQHDIRLMRRTAFDRVASRLAGSRSGNPIVARHSGTEPAFKPAGGCVLTPSSRVGRGDPTWRGRSTASRERLVIFGSGERTIPTEAGPLPC